ncbi:MAG TPA: bifunctional oligoribonuclease/PAP phosphatase NrnA [Ignavibacteriaceae bacterium]|nr:bifunctional oligoribonuclease/PAP phosphatase NrnA [Ignavibacteriaceae bacterium]
MIDFKELEEIILNNKSFLLSTHVNPDADALGSEIAFYLVLKKLGKDVHIINHSAIPYNLLFLDIDNRIEQYNPDKHDKIINSIDVFVALDFNRTDRLVKMEKAVVESPSYKICIDHHQEPSDFASKYFIDTDYSSTGEIIYDFIENTKIVDIDYDIAVPLYAAIMTDTGSFRFDRTTPKIHRITARLLELNVKPHEVFDKIYDNSLFSKLKLMGKAMDSLQLYGEKKQIGYMVITQDMINEVGAIESDTDNFVNYALSVEFVRIGLMFIELKHGFKVSFRSKGKIPINKLAAEFGGGGHLNAAGARIFENNMMEKIPHILKRAEEYLEF